MRTLVIDTATQACSVALFEDERLVASRFEIIGRGHAEQLLVYVSELPERGRADKIAVNVGPGSFTGIRVGISAAKALALAWKAECVGYDCLTLVAATASKTTDADAAVDVIMTGGHGEYFFRSFGSDGSPVSEAVSLPMNDVLEYANAPLIAGNAMSALHQSSPDLRAIEIHPDASRWPLIAHLEPLPPSATYGRPPDAKPMSAA